MRTMNGPCFGRKTAKARNKQGHGGETNGDGKYTAGQ